MTPSPVVVSALIEVAIGMIAAVVAIIAWQHRRIRASRPLVVMAVGTCLYALSAAASSFVTDPVWWRLGNNIRYPLGAAIAVGSFFVMVAFSERDQLQNRWIRALLAGFVVVNFVVAMTDPLHNQFITAQQLVDGVVVGTAGPLFWVHTITSLGIVFLATGLCLGTFLTSSGIHRKQSLSILSAFGVGIVGFAWQSIAPVHPALDLAAVGMLGWCGIILWGIFAADFFDIVPVGRERVVERIDDPVVILDGNDRVLDSNPAARRLATSSSEWHGMPVSEFFESSPELADRVTARTPGEITLEQSGTTRRFDVTISPLDTGHTDPGDRKQQSESAVVILRDVTAQFTYQRELERSRERYRSLFENSPLVLWEQDLSKTIERARTIAADTDDLAAYLEEHPEQHRELVETVEILDVNEVAVEAYDAESKSELVDRMGELFTDEALATSRHMLEELIDGDRHFRAETTYRTLDGDTRHELIEVFVPEPYVADCSRVLVAGADITVQKERETELRYQTALFEALNESTNVGVLVTNTDREILWYNDRFRELWGIPEEILAAGRDRDAVEYVLDSLADPDRFVAATEDLHRPPFEPLEMELRLLDGRWFERYTAPVTDDDGTRYGLLTLTRDITERKRYERRIESQNRRLERLAKVISHDLKTPLSTAENHLKLLEIELADPAAPVEQSLRDLERTHERLRRFTDHLPRLARETTNVHESTDCSLRRLVTDAWEVVDTGSLELTVAEDRRLDGDPRRLQQLFENLFSNVVEHAVDGVAPADTATTVRVEALDTGFAVEDDGPGVSAGNEVFEYGMSTGDGSGIGLAICRSIVEAHGWSVKAVDGDDGGARFVVTTVEDIELDETDSS
ncbi:PAS domain-containing protein [Salinadaptatus halalkaliphilus]|uniref:histidine kinase n=2 Tax=Salinadaptatus halalkaliphilus TaxID=2419781 RepID=A0A4S3TNJ5_9EURY|nr:PAS domain-containing protein [Salinadaptatus halalkaliphilus]